MSACSHAVVNASRHAALLHRHAHTFFRVRVCVRCVCSYYSGGQDYYTHIEAGGLGSGFDLHIDNGEGVPGCICVDWSGWLAAAAAAVPPFARGTVTGSRVTSFVTLTANLAPAHPQTTHSAQAPTAAPAAASWTGLTRVDTARSSTLPLPSTSLPRITRAGTALSSCTSPIRPCTRPIRCVLPRAASVPA